MLKIFSTKKEKYSCDRCSVSSIYLGAVETLICHREIESIMVYFLQFAQTKIHDFQNTVLNSQWHCLRQIPQKIFFTQLTLSNTNPGFYMTAVENTVGKGEIARNEQFLLFPQCFLSFLRTIHHFYQA